MRSEIDHSLKRCFQHATNALSKVTPKMGRPYEARSALALFWEACKSGRLNHSENNYRNLMKERIEAKFWNVPLGYESKAMEVLNSIQGNADISDDEFLVGCSIICRFLDAKIASDDMDWIDEELGQEGESTVSVELLPGSLFSPHNSKLGDFDVLTKAEIWPNLRKKIEQLKLPNHSIRKHAVIPHTIGQLKINLVRPDLTSRNKSLFVSGSDRSKLLVRTMPNAFQGVRDWPTDETKRPLNFAGSFGVEGELRAETIKRKVREGLEQGANVIVFPELTASVETFEHLTELLEDSEEAGDSAAIIVPGTAHLECDRGFRRNQAVLMYQDGAVALRQNKIQPFFDSHASSETAFGEDVMAGDTINLLPTPVGLTIIQICKDFCDALATHGNDITDILDVGLVLVPSMGGGSTVSAHKVKLKANAKLGVPLVALAQQSDGFGSSDNFLAYRNSNGRFSDDGADTDPGKLFPNCNDCHEVATLLEASG